jgi:hypothetical protein
MIEMQAVVTCRDDHDGNEITTAKSKESLLGRQWEVP